jgi:hypothetical protein
MRQPRHRLRLAPQPLVQLLDGDGVMRARRIGEQQLQRHAAIELGIVGGVDDAHAAATEHVDDEVAADRRAAGERRRGVGVYASRLPLGIAAGDLAQHLATDGAAIEMALSLRQPLRREDSREELAQYLLG